MTYFSFTSTQIYKNISFFSHFRVGFPLFIDQFYIKISIDTEFA